MKHFKVLLFLFIIIAGGKAIAQPFKVIKATSQRWVGGVVGNHGVKYNIELETSRNKIIPDTLWINGETYPLDIYSKYGNCKRTYDSITGKTTYAILVAESHNDMHRRAPAANDTLLVKPKPVMQFDGTALLSYYVKSHHPKKECRFKITSFTTLQTLNYP